MGTDMPDQDDLTIENEEIETEAEEVAEPDPVEEEGQEVEASDTEAEESEGEDEDDSLVISLEDEKLTPDEEEDRRAPKWVQDLRKEHRQIIRERNQLREELRAVKESPRSASVVEDIGPEPSMDDPDVDYDADKFKAKLLDWTKKKADKDVREAQIRAEQEREQQRWASQKQAYDAAKSKLKVRDFDVAESKVLEDMSPVQQAVLLEGWTAERASMLVYAIGKSPKALNELKAITNPIKFAVAVADLEKRLKVANTKKAPPTPEKTVRSGVSGAAAVDNQLAKLQAEADKTGDRSKVARYIREKAKRSA